MNQHALDVLEFDKVRKLLVEQASCGLGQRLVRALTPDIDPEEIGRRIAETTELKTLLAPSQELPMGGVHDIYPQLESLEQGEDILLSEDILLIHETLKAGRTVKSYFEDKAAAYPNLQRFSEHIAAYQELEETIERTFTEGGVMKNSASSELRSLRRTVEQLRTKIHGKLQSVLRSKSVSSFLQDTSVRDGQGRPAIAVKAQYASRVPGMQRGRSDSGNTVFIEPDAVVGLGNELDAARDAEKTEMARIMREITAMIAAKVEPLKDTLHALAHLDMTYAKVRLSRLFNMHPPELNTEGILRLNNACHPLLLAMQINDKESEYAPAVPINVRLGDEFHTLIITGPNTGGKTVTLKTIGLLVLMAQSGMHLPADPGSTVSVCRYVAADIGDEQSIEQSLSTFSSHLTHIAEILSNAGKDSLVLLDELGGGTDPAEGAALARAILDYLHTRDTRTVVSTHISQLKQLGYTVPGIENASIEFDIETLRPTHRLMIGTPGSSNALAIAWRLGLPEEVLDHAASGPDEDDTAEMINALQAARAQSVENRQETDRARAEALRLEQEHRTRLESVEAREAIIDSHADQAVAETLERIKTQLDRLRKTEPSRRALLNALSDLGHLIDNPSDIAPHTAATETFQPGDTVRVRSLDSGRRGENSGLRKSVFAKFWAPPYSA